jgi:hypothetical protein
MSRNLDTRINWTDPQVEIENVDWDTNASDFEKLYHVVVNRLDTKLALGGIKELIGSEVLRAEVRRAASRFEERYISLPMFVYLRVKEFVATELVQRKRPSDCDH